MNRYFGLAAAAMLLVLFVMVLLIGGCEKKENTVQPTCTPELTVLAIICNPLAPAPGDTTQLTAQAVGISCTSLPDFQWQVDAGTLVDTAGISVRWVAPADKGVYRVFMRSSLGPRVDTLSKLVMVRDFETVNTGINYSLAPTVVHNELYFLGSTIPTTSLNFMGYHVYRRAAGLTELMTRGTGSTQVMGTQSIVFLNDAVLASVVTDGSQFYRQQPMSVMLFPYDIIEFPTFVAKPRPTIMTRYDQNTSALTTADEALFIWQQSLVGEKEDGTADLINIAYKVGAAGQTLRLTTNIDTAIVQQTGDTVLTYYRNVHPLISPDQSKILYFVDSTSVPEPCLVPLSGTTPVISQRHMLKPDPTKKPGIFQSSGVRLTDRTIESTIFEWNPAANEEVAFIDDSKKLCILNVATENVQILSDVGSVFEYAWSSDGRIAAVTAAGISIVNQSGIPDTVFLYEKIGDELHGVSWSSDPSDPKLAFRMVRKGKSTSDSYSALIIYSFNARAWYYASPRIQWATEPTVSFKYHRVLFEANNGGIYFAAPILDAGVGRVRLFHSF